MKAETPVAHMVSMAGIIGRQERFLIPLYQRLYVWKPEQVQRMMDDIIAAWQQGKPVYYLGGILAIRRAGEQAKREELELIDGQQRLTTLWLLAVAWSDREGGGSLVDFARAGGAPRIHFAIREDVNQFLRATLAGEPGDPGGIGTAAMEEALVVLQGYPGTRAEGASRLPSRAELAAYIRNNVKFALTEVPQHTDLNKLFEVINNRGEQLQHHDILKQRLLECITDGAEREAYARLWEACAAMDGYVERNLVKVQGQTINEGFKTWYRFTEPADLGDTEALVAYLRKESNQGTGDPLSLEEILGQRDPDEDTAEFSTSSEEEGPAIQSILSFPLLLQHTLRIFRHRAGQADIDHIHDKDLLAIFGEFFFSVPQCDDNEDSAKAFIRLLWEVRLAFDSYVAKWVERDQGERHLDVRRIFPGDGFARAAEGVPRGLSLLQAAIYHSQGKTTQYWLTPFLHFALANPDWGDALVYLEYLDHVLFTKPSGQSLLKLSRKMLDATASEPVVFELPDVLNGNDGTDTRHYWFYKTEYVIWKTSAETISVPGQWRIVARNSVEHIAPQQAIGDRNEVGEWLHNFANLALVSREENSRYGNDIFEQKKKKYEAGEETTRSLKLGLAFRHQEWSVDTIEAHQRELARCWEGYLDQLAKQVAQRLTGRYGSGGKNVANR